MSIKDFISNLGTQGRSVWQGMNTWQRGATLGSLGLVGAGIAAVTYNGCGNDTKSYDTPVQLSLPHMSICTDIDLDGNPDNGREVRAHLFEQTSGLTENGDSTVRNVLKLTFPDGRVIKAYDENADGKFDWGQYRAEDGSVNTLTGNKLSALSTAVLQNGSGRSARVTDETLATDITDAFNGSL
jgi:hypothetical protein